MSEPYSAMDFFETLGLGAPRGPVHKRELGDGRCLWVYPLTFGRARLVIGDCMALGYDDGW